MLYVECLKNALSYDHDQVSHARSHAENRNLAGGGDGPFWRNAFLGQKGA